MQLVREDWKLFRSIETLCQKAGVHRQFIPLLVVKELVDNALDATGDCDLELVDDYSFRVTDNGEGIDPDWIEKYFSINRPMISSKLLRIPSRGALGNGLRVVTGAVIATGGKITVTTRGKVYKINPSDDGLSRAELIGSDPHQGTSILVQLGMSINNDTLYWGNIALLFTRNGSMYQGKSSPFWYTSEAFYELINAADMPIEEFAGLFCEPRKANLITNQLVFEMGVSTTKNFDFDMSEQLLFMLRQEVKPVPPKAIGEVGHGFRNTEYHKKADHFNMYSSRGRFDAKLPVVVEAWVSLGDRDSRSTVTVCVNKSPVTADVKVETKQAQTTIWGGGMYIELKSRAAVFYINIITPYMPITSDGKAPDFRPMSAYIEAALKRAASKAKKVNHTALSGGRNEKEIILDHLSDAIDKTSGNGSFLFSQRQLYYAIRPYIMEALGGKQPKYTYFCKVITDYETEYGDIPGMYRDPRGTLYHPHTQEEISLGTIAVQRYNRPKWTFNKIIFIEKEGYFESLKDVGFPEKYDCALLSSKGYASRAVKDLFDLLGETNEEIQFFCVHDADAAGTMIFQTLQESTSARPGRRVKVINLGLDPEEATDKGLQVESFESNQKRAVADYVSYEWEDWLQSNRVELNAMTTPEFIQWLEDKMEEHGVGKVIPTADVLHKTLEVSTEKLIQQQVMESILAKNDFQGRVEQALIEAQSSIDRAKEGIADRVGNELQHNPHSRWDATVSKIANEIINPFTA